MTPKIYRIIPGHELTADQWLLLEADCSALAEGGFAWEKGWYFTADGTRFLGAWRDL